MAKTLFCDIEMKQRYMIAVGLDSPHSSGILLFPTSCYWFHCFQVGSKNLLSQKKA